MPGSQIGIEEKLRAFIALPLPEQVHAPLIALQTGIDHVHWVPPENFHITISFLGYLNTAQFLRVSEVLPDINIASFSLHLKEIVLWHHQLLCIEMERSAVLSELKSIIDNKMLNLGIAIEKREFKPHITLSRLKKNSNEEQIDSYIEKHHQMVLNKVVIDRFALYESIVSEHGMRYRIQRYYSLHQ